MASGSLTFSKAQNPIPISGESGSGGSSLSQNDLLAALLQVLMTGSGSDSSSPPTAPASAQDKSPAAPQLPSYAPTSPNNSGLQTAVNTGSSSGSTADLNNLIQQLAPVLRNSQGDNSLRGSPYAPAVATAAPVTYSAQPAQQTYSNPPAQVAQTQMAAPPAQVDAPHTVAPIQDQNVAQQAPPQDPQQDLTQPPQTTPALPQAPSAPAAPQPVAGAAPPDMGKLMQQMQQSKAQGVTQQAVSPGQTYDMGQMGSMPTADFSSLAGGYSGGGGATVGSYTDAGGGTAGASMFSGGGGGMSGAASGVMSGISGIGQGIGQMFKGVTIPTVTPGALPPLTNFASFQPRIV